MSWMELSLNTTDEAVDWVCTLLRETDYISDICINRHNHPSWTSTIYIYLVNDFYANTRTNEIENLLSSLQRTGLVSALEIAIVEQKSMPVEASSSLVRIGKRFVILAPDVSFKIKSAAADEIVVRLKTSLAFGSGLHPATILALQLIERYVMPSMHVLDLGSGSGILSVAAAKLGATVLALDNDLIAVQSTQDAVYRNCVEPQVKVMAGSLGRGSELGNWMGGNTIVDVPAITPANNFDLIVANIFARIHITLIPDYQQALRQNNINRGILITAGFTSDYESTLVAALEDAGFEVIDCVRVASPKENRVASPKENCLDEWVALAFSPRT